MDRLSALSRGTQIMLVGGILLLIDTFLPWQDFDLGGVAEELGVDASFNAWHGFWGVAMGLLVIVLLAWIVVRIASVDIPLPVSQAMTAALLGTLILFFAVIKNIVDDESTIWSYIGVVLAIVIAVGAWQQVQEAGGVDTLKSEIPSRPATGAAASTQTAPPAETPPASEPPAAPTEAAPPASEPPPAEPPSSQQT
jgi:hypothetical protein